MVLSAGSWLRRRGHRRGEAVVLRFLDKEATSRGWEGAASRWLEDEGDVDGGLGRVFSAPRHGGSRPRRRHQAVEVTGRFGVLVVPLSGMLPSWVHPCSAHARGGGFGCKADVQSSCG